MEQLISELQNVSEESKKTFGHLSNDQINFKPNPKSWSIAQCFEHLIVTNNLYFPNIQKVIEGNHRNNFFSKIPFGVDLIGALMKNSLKPEQSRKMKTFKIFEPAKSAIPTTILDDFVENNQKLISMVEAVKALDTRKIKIAEPLSITLNLRLADAFEILAMHERRHFLQAERVMKMEIFPK